MAYRTMYTIDRDDTDSSAWFHTVVTISGGTYSDIYRIPVQRIDSIGATISGSGSLEFTMDSLAAMDNDTAVFEAWDGIAVINPSVTGFRVAWNSGLVKAQVIVKTSSPS